MIKDKFTSVDPQLTDETLLNYVNEILVEHEFSLDNILVEDTDKVRIYEIQTDADYISIAFINDTKEYYVVLNDEQYFGEII